MTDFYNGMPSGDIPDAAWRKDWSGSNGGACVEAARLPGGRVAVRQSTDPEGPALIFTHAEITAFVEGAKAGQADFLLLYPYSARTATRPAGAACPARRGGRQAPGTPLAIRKA